jgi:hypothetical protein
MKTTKFNYLQKPTIAFNIDFYILLCFLVKKFISFRLLFLLLQLCDMTDMCHHFSDRQGILNQRKYLNNNFYELVYYAL